VTVSSDRPYAQFNYLVVLGVGSRSAEAGFQEIGGLGMDVGLAQPRTPQGRARHIEKLLGGIKSANLTMKRGVVRSSSFEQWMRDLREERPDARQVMIQLQKEDHSGVAATWRVVGARIIKHTSGPMNAAATDVAMEELVLAYDRLEIE
jgi:phage tail-like protein